MLTKGNWSDVTKRVSDIAVTEESYMFAKKDMPEILKANRFSANGLSQLGSKTHFPAVFVNDLLRQGHGKLADEIVTTKTNDFFTANENGEMFFREFAVDGVKSIHGVLSSRYSVFDDKEAVEIISASDYLMNAAEVWYDVSPDQFHARFVSSEKLFINGDSSPLSMCVFVDNSMVGKSMFRIRFGLYRWACTNGMITDFKEFQILRERHVGIDKDWKYIVAQAVLDVKKYESMLLDKVNNMAATKSAIYDMDEEDAIRYIRDKLATSKKKAREILTCYNTVYGAFSKWDLCNAITEVAHNVDSLETRLSFESKAMKVA